MSFDKRRRLDHDSFTYQVAPSTSRTQAKAAASNRAAQEAARLQARKDSEGHTLPLMNLAHLPPQALQRYLSRYGLLEAHGTLSYHHSVFPVPPLPTTIAPPLTGRVLNIRRRPTLVSSIPPTAEELANGGNNNKKRPWQEPKTEEFRGVTAYDDPQLVTNRLANKAKEHWDKRDSVKEGETLTNFMFALRMRAHTLRATPQG